MVILREYDDKKIVKYIEKLENLINEENSHTKDEILISVAYGIAKSDESKDNDYKTILNMADSRMYENKAKMKKERYDGDYGKNI